MSKVLKGVGPGGHVAGAVQGPTPAGPGLLVTLTTCMGIGPLLIYGLTATAPLVIEDLALSRTQFGSLAGTAFAAAALTSALIGRSVDERSERMTLATLFAGAGLALILAATAGSYLIVLLAVVVSGGAQALSNPVSNRLVAAYAPPDKRGLLMGIKQSGVQMAQLTAAITLPTMAIFLGWRGALAATATLAAVGLVVAWLTVPQRPTTESRPEGRVSCPLPPVVWWLTAHALLSGAALQAVNVYLPLYGYEELNLSVTVAALTVAVVGGVGLIARIVWGQAADRVRSPWWPLLALSLVALASVLGIVLAGELAMPSLLWLGAVAFGASGIAANVVLMVAVVRAVPLEATGRASGVLAIGLYLGFAAGPLAFGALVDGFHSYAVAWSAVGAAYAVTVLLLPLAGYRHQPISRPVAS
jgi:predicted MFS family arabinose efflux permease